MAAAEWLRTFVAVYRRGSVSGGAAERHLSQPAASQQLAALERRVGLPLFVRTPQGVEPTPRGRELHAQVADSLDRLEHVLAGIDAGVVDPRSSAVRLGSSAEFFSYAVLPTVTPDWPALIARFGPDDELLQALEGGEIDLAITSAAPPRRSVTSTPLGNRHFVLVADPRRVPDTPFPSLDELGRWLVGRPWVAYSAELPLTRRFWLASLGRPFAGDLRLVAPDLRAVVAAVARGMGISLLPAFVCTEAVQTGSVAEVHPVAHVAPVEPWFACTRSADQSWEQLGRVISALADHMVTDATGLPFSR
jgi:DNA-binding transcriptional LysR family regulator